MAWRRIAALVLVVSIAVVAISRSAPASDAAPVAATAPATADANAPANDPAAAIPARKTAPPLPPEYIDDSVANALGQDGSPSQESWIHLAYHPSMRERARSLVADATEFRRALREQLGADVLSSIEVRIAAPAPGEMDRLAPSKPEGAGGAATFADLGLIVIAPPSPLALDPASLSDLLRHQLARLALDQALEGSGQTAARSGRAAAKVPAWFREGYAAHVAGDNAGLRAQTLIMASLRGSLQSLADIARGSPSIPPQASIAYAEAADFVRFLTQPGSQARFVSLIAMAKGGAPFERALSAAYAQSPDEIELAWRKDMARRYSFMPVLLGSTIVWVAGVALLAARRARRARERRPMLVRHARRTEPEARVRIVTVPAASRTTAVEGRLVRADAPSSDRARIHMPGEPEMSEPPPPDAEVPKIEHEGQWHTLH